MQVAILISAVICYILTLLAWITVEGLRNNNNNK